LHSIKKTPPPILHNSVIYCIVKFSSAIQIFFKTGQRHNETPATENRGLATDREFILKNSHKKSIKKNLSASVHF
jgi:hypothetical protein